MKKISVTIREIKAIKRNMDNLDKLKEKNEVHEKGKNVTYNGKEKLINYHEKQIKNDCEIVAKLLGTDYDTVIDMCYDFVFANYVLDDLKKNGI